MLDVAWRRITSRLGWLVAVTFVVAMALYALGQFHIVVPEPPGPTGGTLVDDLLQGFEHAQAHFYPWDLTSSLLLAAGFVGLAILGVTLRAGLGKDDARGVVLAVTFLVAGTIGAASQILFVGATEVATRPEYCDCGFLAEEIISRQMAQDIALNVVFWMTDASIVVFAIGLLAFGGLAAASGWVPGGLAVYARVLAVLAVLSVVWGRVVVPLLTEGGVDFDFFRVGDVIIIVVTGILVPIWAAWVAMATRPASAGAEETSPEHGQG
jgi:hypothetical protein